MPATPLIHGIAVVPKQGGDPVAEWFPTEAQRDEFFAWYQQHGRICTKTSKVDAAAVARAEDRAYERALNVARAGRATQHAAPTYVGLSGGVGLALGVAFGGLF